MRRAITGFSFVVLAGVLSACGASSPREPYDPTPIPVGEPILGWHVEDNGDLVARVRSGGCTTKASFDPFVEGGPSWDFDVELIRVHPDHCEAFFPNGVEVTFTREDLGLPRGARIQVINPVRR